MDQNQIELAIQKCSALIKKNKNNFEYINLRGILHDLQKSYQLALKDFNKAYQLSKADETLYLKAFTLLNMGQTEEAIEAVRFIGANNLESICIMRDKIINKKLSMIQKRLFDNRYGLGNVGSKVN